MFHKKRLLCVILGASFITIGAAQADVGKLVKECDDCHGKNGNSTEQKVPTIAGFSAATLEDIMTQYKKGDRQGVKYKKKGKKETDMNEIAKKLSEGDIKALAAHYAKQTFKPHKQKFNAKLAKRGAKKHDRKCEKCHSDGGTNADDDAAILAGQWRGYLEEQFDLIKKGDRTVPKKMRKKFRKVKDKDLKALIEYYVSQQ